MKLIVDIVIGMILDQDDSISPSGGILILIDETDLHKKYNFGM